MALNLASGIKALQNLASNLASQAGAQGFTNPEPGFQPPMEFSSFKCYLQVFDNTADIFPAMTARTQEQLENSNGNLFEVVSCAFNYQQGDALCHVTLPVGQQIVPPRTAAAADTSSNAANAVNALVSNLAEQIVPKFAKKFAGIAPLGTAQNEQPESYFNELINGNDALHKGCVLWIQYGYSPLFRCAFKGYISHSAWVGSGSSKALTITIAPHSNILDSFPAASAILRTGQNLDKNVCVFLAKDPGDIGSSSGQLISCLQESALSKEAMQANSVKLQPWFKNAINGMLELNKRFFSRYSLANNAVANDQLDVPAIKKLLQDNLNLLERYFQSDIFTVNPALLLDSEICDKPSFRLYEALTGFFGNGISTQSFLDMLEHLAREFFLDVVISANKISLEPIAHFPKTVKYIVDNALSIELSKILERSAAAAVFHSQSASLESSNKQSTITNSEVFVMGSAAASMPKNGFIAEFQVPAWMNAFPYRNEVLQGGTRYTITSYNNPSKISRKIEVKRDKVTSMLNWIFEGIQSQQYSLTVSMPFTLDIGYGTPIAVRDFKNGLAYTGVVAAVSGKIDAQSKSASTICRLQGVSAMPLQRLNRMNGYSTDAAYPNPHPVYGQCYFGNTIDE